MSVGRDHGDRRRDRRDDLPLTGRGGPQEAPSGTTDVVCGGGMPDVGGDAASSGVEAWKAMDAAQAEPSRCTGAHAGLIGVLGFLAVAAWDGWRFGPNHVPTSQSVLVVGLGSVASADYGYCVAFLLLGALAWGGGTIWYAKRRGRWPSALSARLFARLLGKRNPVTHVELPAVVIAPRRHR